MAAVVSAVLADSKLVEDEVEAALRSAREVGGYWAMLDLKGSPAFRQSMGEARAYVRAEVFVKTLRRLCETYPGVRLFKEMGDGALIYSPDFRPLAEIGCVLDGVSQYWASEAPVADAERTPFEYRFAVTKGECFNLSGIDYLGTPLDSVARLCGHKVEGLASIMTVSSEVRLAQESKIHSAYEFLSFGPDFAIKREILKAGERQMFACELYIAREQFRGFTDYFAEIREATDRQLDSR